MTPAYARRLVVMAKAPRAGAVKTRLGRDIGAAPAAFLYRHLLARTLRRLGGDPRWRTIVAVTPDAAITDYLGAIGQGGGDLGRRMDRIMHVLPPGPVVIVGTDIADMAPRDIADAFAALGRADAVFGPAEDGGYWLVGLRRSPRVPSIFGAVRWSGRDALADTLRNCAGLDVAMLDRRRDIDTLDDHRAFLVSGGLRL